MALPYCADKSMPRTACPSTCRPVPRRFQSAQAKACAARCIPIPVGLRHGAAVPRRTEHVLQGRPRCAARMVPHVVSPPRRLRLHHLPGTCTCRRAPGAHQPLSKPRFPASKTGNLRGAVHRPAPPLLPRTRAPSTHPSSSLHTHTHTHTHTHKSAHPMMHCNIMMYVQSFAMTCTPPPCTTHTCMHLRRPLTPRCTPIVYFCGCTDGRVKQTLAAGHTKAYHTQRTPRRAPARLEWKCRSKLSPCCHPAHRAHLFPWPRRGAQKIGPARCTRAPVRGR